MHRIAILGSTGSIGKQALSAAACNGERFEIVALTAYRDHAALFAQVRTFRPKMAGLVIPPEHIPEDVRFCQWVFGEDCLSAAATYPQADAVLVSVVGVAGLPAVLAAIGAGKRILLANKEALVAGGALVMEAAERAGVPILPVDSEHSAIFQCLQGAGPNAPKKLWLTASGGPFRTWTREAIAKATLTDALRHPNWTMGQKITVDSATMMNKALEVIEARWLFAMQPEDIEVLIHPQSIVHSMVQYADGAIMAQLGAPDMRLPILYAMAYPDRLDTGGPGLSPEALSTLTFERPDGERFPGLALAYEVLKAGGTAPCILNGANEVAVSAFIAGRIPFSRIVPIVSETLQQVPARAAASLEGILHADGEARRMAASLLA